MSLLGAWLRTWIGRPHCVLCHEPVPTFGLCPACHRDLDYLARSPEAVCSRCTRISTRSTVCGHCQQQPPFTEALYASYEYAPPLRQLLHAYKHLKQFYLAQVLAELMLSQPPTWLKSLKFDAVVAMPLSKQRLFKRGFNQSRLLAQIIAKSLACPLLDIKDIQREHREAQSTLNGAQRRQNVKGIFVIRANVENLNLLLIDDVVTTGATMDALAQALKQAGAARVFGWALSHPE